MVMEMFKKIIVLLLLSLAVCGYACGPEYGYTFVRRSQVFIVNTDEFPEYNFYSFGQHNNFFSRSFKVTSKTRLRGGGYDNLSIRIVAVNKDVPNQEIQLLKPKQNPLIFDFCNISPYHFNISNNFVIRDTEKIVFARTDYKIAKIEDKTVHLYLYRTVTTDDWRVITIKYFKQPEIFSYPQSVEKKVQEYQSVITRYFQEYNLSDEVKSGFAVFRIYLNPDKTVSFQGDMSSGDWDSYRSFINKIYANLTDRQSSGTYNSSPYYINFGFKIDSSKIYFEKSYNPYIKSLYHPEVLKTVVDTLVRVPVRKEFKLGDYLTKDFYLKLLSSVVMESFLLLLLSFFMPAIKNMKIIRLVGVCALASVITLPLLWFLWPQFTTNWLLYLWTGEIMVAAIEAVIYKKLLKTNWLDAVIISVACNAFSCMIGLYANVWW